MSRAASRDHSRDQSLASTASTAVADGALLAGPLLKRSEWLHVWNARFVVLTTEVLAWLRTAAVLDGGEKEQRAVLLHSSLRLDASDGETLQITVPGGAPLMFRASSAAELRSWHRVLGSLLSALQAEAAEVAAVLRERSSLLAPRPCTELAHMGSRNMRASRITKVWYLCASASADESFARSGPLIDPYRASALAPTGGGGLAGLGGSGGSGGSGENGGRALLLLSLLQLPTAWPLWEGAAPRAFHSILEQLAGSGVPGLLPPIHAEALPRRRRVLVLRRLLPRGSLRDHMHAVSTPTLPSSVKYGTALLSHPASAVLTAAASAAALAAERSSRHSGSAPPRLNAALERSAVPLPARLASSVGRRVLAAAAALEARGLPASHLHAGNVLLDEHACRLSEYELPLLGLPPYHELLAKPRPHPLATEPFRVRPSTLAAAHLLYEMVAGASLSDAALARWEGSGEPAAVGEPAAAAADPASHHAWRLLRSIFLPPSEATEAPTIAAMLRSPFFAPEASAGAQPSSAADGGGRGESPSQWSSEEEAPPR